VSQSRDRRRTHYWIEAVCLWCGNCRLPLSAFDKWTVGPMTSQFGPAEKYSLGSRAICAGQSCKSSALQAFERKNT
jgi:hypothetical protein